MLQLKQFPLIRKTYFPILFLIIITFGFISAAIIFDKTINKESIIQAENIIGLNFNDTKRDSLIESLNVHLKNYQNIRESFLLNDIGPSLIFNPDRKSTRLNSSHL